MGKIYRRITTRKAVKAGRLTKKVEDFVFTNKGFYNKNLFKKDEQTDIFDLF